MITWNCVIFIVFIRLLLQLPNYFWNTGAIFGIIVALYRAYSKLSALYTQTTSMNATIILYIDYGY